MSQTSPRAPDDEMVGALARSVKFEIESGVMICMLTIVIRILIVLSLAVDESEVNRSNAVGVDEDHSSIIGS